MKHVNQTILWSTPSTQLYVEHQACKRTEFIEHESRPSTRAHKARKVHENTSTLISRLIDTVSLLIFELCVQFIHRICYSKIGNDVWKIIAENLAPFSIAWDSFNLFLGKLIFSLLGFFFSKKWELLFPRKNLLSLIFLISECDFSADLRFFFCSSALEIKCYLLQYDLISRKSLVVLSNIFVFIRYAYAETIF